MKYIYFEIDNLSLLIEWLQTSPPEKYTLVIGTGTELDRVDILVHVTIHGSLDLAMGLINKLAEGDLRILITSKIEVPQGVEL